MNEKQIYLIHWLYNFAIVEMMAQPNKFLKTDQAKLKEAVERRFPDYAEKITKQFDI